MSTWAARKLAKENGQPVASTSKLPPVPIFIHPSQPLPARPSSTLGPSFPAQPIASTSSLPAKPVSSIALGTTTAYVPGKGSGFVSIALNGHAKKVNGTSASSDGPITPSPTAASFSHRRLSSKHSIESGELTEDGLRNSKHSIESGELVEEGSSWERASRAARDISKSLRGKGKHRETHGSELEEEEHFQPIIPKSSKSDLKESRRKSPESTRKRKESDASRYEDHKPLIAKRKSIENVRDGNARSSRSPRRRRDSSVGRTEEGSRHRSVSRISFRKSLKDEYKRSGEDVRSRRDSMTSRAGDSWSAKKRDRCDSDSERHRSTRGDYYERSRDRYRERDFDRSRSRSRRRSRERPRRSEYASDSDYDRRDHHRTRDRDRARDREYDDGRERRTRRPGERDEYRPDYDETPRYRDRERRRDRSYTGSPSPIRARLSPAKRGRTRQAGDHSPGTNRSVSNVRDKLQIKSRVGPTSSPGGVKTNGDALRDSLGIQARQDSPNARSLSPDLPPPVITRALPPHLALPAAARAGDASVLPKEDSSELLDTAASVPPPRKAISISLGSISNKVKAERPTPTDGSFGHSWSDVTAKGSLPATRSGAVSISMNGSTTVGSKNVNGKQTSAIAESGESPYARIKSPTDEVPPPPPSPPAPPPEPLADPDPPECQAATESEAPTDQNFTQPAWTAPVMPAAAYVIPDRGNYFVTFDPASDGKDAAVILKAKRKNKTLPKHREIRYDGVSKGKHVEVSDPRLEKGPADLAKLRAMISMVPMEELQYVKPYPWTIESVGPAPSSALCITGLHPLTTLDQVKRAMRDFGVVVDIQPKLDRQGQQMGICWLKLRAFAVADDEQGQILADHAAADAAKTRFNGQRIGTAQVEAVSITMDSNGSEAEGARMAELQRRHAVVKMAAAERNANAERAAAAATAAAHIPLAPSNTNFGFNHRAVLPIRPIPVPQVVPVVRSAYAQQNHNQPNFPARAAVGTPLAPNILHAHLPFHPRHQEWLLKQASAGHEGSIGEKLPPSGPRAQRLPLRPPVATFNGNMASFAEDPFHANGGTSDSHHNQIMAPGTSAKRKDDKQHTNDATDTSAARETSARTSLLPSRFLSPPRSRRDSPRQDSSSDSSDSDGHHRQLPLISPGRRRLRRGGDLNIRLRSPCLGEDKRDELVAAALRANPHDYVFIPAKTLTARKDLMEEVSATFDMPRPSMVLFNSHGWYILFDDAAGARRTTTLKKQNLTINGRAVILQLKKGSMIPSPRVAISEKKPAERTVPPMSVISPRAAAKIQEPAVTSAARAKRSRVVVQSDSDEEQSSNEVILVNSGSHGIKPRKPSFAHQQEENSAALDPVALVDDVTPAAATSEEVNAPIDVPAASMVDAPAPGDAVAHTLAAPAPPKHRGWPKGKPRGKGKAMEQSQPQDSPSGSPVFAAEAEATAKSKVVAKKDKARPKKKAKIGQEITPAAEKREDTPVSVDDPAAISMQSSAAEKVAIRASRPVDVGSATRLPRNTPVPLHELISAGLVQDDEDLYLLRLAAEASRSGAIPELPNPTDDDAADEGNLGPHPSGSARTHGYYKISETAKSAYLPQRNKAAVDEEAIPVAAVGNSRSTRVATRRLVLGMEQHKKAATDSDVFQFNQLRTRKKQLKFSKSPIHDWGLYAVEAIPLGEMVIEYVGEVIRAQVADIREKWYEKIGIGSSYLFRVDDDAVVDATKKGNLGRLINHCCTPNCTAKIITINGDKKIVIYARENIEPGHEITYDYHFPIEQEKIVCLCGSAKCRGFLN